MIFSVNPFFADRWHRCNGRCAFFTDRCPTTFWYSYNHIFLIYAAKWQNMTSFIKNYFRNSKRTDNIMFLEIFRLNFKFVGSRLMKVEQRINYCLVSVVFMLFIIKNCWIWIRGKYSCPLYTNCSGHLICPCPSSCHCEFPCVSSEKVLISFLITDTSVNNFELCRAQNYPCSYLLLAPNLLFFTDKPVLLHLISLP